ncbi:SpoIIIAH-like family protein [Desulfotomaculum varum]
MSKRFWMLGLLTVMGITMLLVGYRGGTGEIFPARSLDGDSGQQPAAFSHGKQEAASDHLQPTAGSTVKQDRPPTGQAVQVERRESGSSFFVEYRLERERNRGQQIEIAREIINNQNADPEIRKKAQEQLYNISNQLQKELETESLIRAKGYRDAVVFLEGKTVTVVIQADRLNQEDAMKITDLVSRSTQINSQNIVIIPKA